MHTGLTWVIEKRNSKKFPYRLKIKSGNDVVLCLNVQELWPGEKGNVFCVRVDNRICESEGGEIVESVPVISFRRYGRKLAVILARPTKKRCDFIFLKKRSKSGKEYEQIFWRTEKALRDGPVRARLSTQVSGNLNIVIDVSEKYPWRFPGAEVERKKLPVGDYALLHDGEYVAFVERKTFDNFLQELNNLPLFHQKLADLESYPNSVLVVEGNYSDFLDPAKNKHMSIVITRRGIGELFAFHPHLPIVFAGKRKVANEWVVNFFKSVKSNVEDRILFERQWKDIPEKRGVIKIPDQVERFLKRIAIKIESALDNNFVSLILYKPEAVKFEPYRVYLHVVVKDYSEVLPRELKKIFNSVRFSGYKFYTVSDIKFSGVRRELIEVIRKNYLIIWGEEVYFPLYESNEQYEIGEMLEKYTNALKLKEYDKLPLFAYKFAVKLVGSYLARRDLKFNEKADDIILKLHKAGDTSIAREFSGIYLLYLNTEFGGMDVDDSVVRELRRRVNAIRKKILSEGS